MDLYVKTGEGKQTRYKLYVPPPEQAPQRSEFTDPELITLAASVGLIVLMECRRLMPEHKRVARNILEVEEAILRLTKGAGGPLDKEAIEYWGDTWNRTMIEFQKGLTPHGVAPAAGGVNA